MIHHCYGISRKNKKKLKKILSFDVQAGLKSWYCSLCAVFVFVFCTLKEQSHSTRTKLSRVVFFQILLSV